MQTRGHHTGTRTLPHLTRFAERRCLLHLETSTKATVLVFHHSKSPNGQETAEPIRPIRRASLTTPSNVRAARSRWLGDVTDYRGASADEGDEIGTKFGGWGE